MTKLQPYTYAVLRYRHDPLAGEMVNVGVLLHASGSRWLGARLRRTYGRLSKLYPDLDGTVLTAELRKIETAVRGLADKEREAAQGLDFGPRELGAGGLGRRILNDPAGTFLWGEEGSGLTADAEATLESLFERFVTRFEVGQQAKRSDADVWKAAREALAARQVASRLAPTTIRSAQDEVTFDHAWKNGVWHVLQPVSFDLADADGIRTKAARWVGHMYGLRQTTEAFRPYFIVGTPSEPALLGSFERALAFLKDAPAPERPVVVRESELAQLAEQLGQEIEEHEALHPRH